MILHKHKNNLSFLRPLSLLTLSAALIAGVTSCNEKKSDDDDSPAYTEPSSLAITGFKLKADNEVLAGLDSVFFSIDLQQGVIYNADSLPKGTTVTDLIPVITYSSYISSATIDMQGGIKRTGEVDYMKYPNDSIDFTGKVSLTIGSSTGGYRTYRLKVNVHEQEPDSLYWGETAMSALPSRMSSPLNQRTVKFLDKTISLIEERDGSYTVATTSDPASDEWDKREAAFSFRPRLRTLTAAENTLFILDDSGRLYSSADALDWTAAGTEWKNITGAYGSTALGISADGSMLVTWPGNEQTPVPDGFPVDEFTNMHRYQSKWMAQPVGIIAGGVDSRGNILSSVWGYDGNRWARLSQEAMPALRGATLVPYYTYITGKHEWNYQEYDTLILLGGIDSEGDFNRDLYISYNNGVTWAKAGQLMQLPSYIPGMWCADNVVVAEKMTGSLQQYWKQMPARRLPSWYRVATEVDGYNVSWECPYIYIFGGFDADGILHDTVWRGLINRLAFMPVF